MPKSSPSDTSLSGSTPASSVPREGSSEFGHSSASSANFDSLSPSIQTQAAPKKHIACRNCRSSKVKCRGDGMGPCPACIRLGEVCLYIPRRPRARRTAAVPGLGVPATETPTAPAKMLMPSPSRGLSAGVGGGDWDYLMRQHWLLPRFGHPTSLHGMVHNVATPGASFVGAALRVLPAFRAVLEAGLMPDASGSQRNLARSIRSMLEVELPRFLDYSSRKGNGTTSPTTSSSTDSEDDVMTNNNRGRNRNSGSSDLALLFSFGALLRFFTATGHVEFGRKVLDASHSVIRRTATRLSKPGAVDRVGGPAAYQVWLRAVWVMVQAEMIRAALTSESKETFAVLQDVSQLPLPDPYHLPPLPSPSASFDGFLPQTTAPPSINLATILDSLFGPITDIQHAALHSQFGMLQQRGAVPLLIASMYCLAVISTLSHTETEEFSMLSLLARFPRFPWIGPLDASPPNVQAASPYMETRASVMRAASLVLTILPDELRVADEAGDIITIAALSEAWWPGAAHNGAANTLCSLVNLHLVAILANSPKPFSDRPIWTADETDPTRNAWIVWMKGPEFLEASTHAIILSRYARWACAALANRTRMTDGSFVAASLSIAPTVAHAMLHAAWVHLMHLSYLKEAVLLAALDPTTTALARAVEEDARLCIDYVIASPWKQAHGPAQALSRMLVAPALGPREEDTAELRHAVDSDR